VRQRLVRRADDLRRRQQPHAHRAGGSIWSRPRGDPFDDDEEAIAIGNDVVYGLAAGVWTTSMRRALKMAEKLQAGTVWINTYRAVSYLSPFGGYKRSGLGRESGQEMIKEYLQVKSVWISTAESVPNPFIQR
jgi:aldehyde dehydrogenase (NAD+)